MWPRAFLRAGAKPDGWDKAGAPGSALSPAPTYPRHLSVLSVAGSASRRLSAGCQASMIGPASDAFLPPPTRCPCGSPGSLLPLHSSSAHTRFPPRRRRPQLSGAAWVWARPSEAGCSPGTGWRGVRGAQPRAVLGPKPSPSPSWARNSPLWPATPQELLMATAATQGYKDLLSLTTATAYCARRVHFLVELSKLYGL